MNSVKMHLLLEPGGQLLIDEKPPENTEGGGDGDRARGATGEPWLPLLVGRSRSYGSLASGDLARPSLKSSSVPLGSSFSGSDAMLSRSVSDLS